MLLPEQLFARPAGKKTGDLISRQKYHELDALYHKNGRKLQSATTPPHLFGD
jgi:hypothetical protein